MRPGSVRTFLSPGEPESDRLPPGMKITGRGGGTRTRLTRTRKLTGRQDAGHCGLEAHAPQRTVFAISQKERRRVKRLRSEIFWVLGGLLGKELLGAEDRVFGRFGD